jgi:hypothetical protein
MTSTPNATAAEALGEKVAFSHNGLDYLVLPTSEWDYEALEAFESGRLVAFLTAVLGPAQHAAFRATKPKVKDVGALVEAIQTALGIAGN